MAKGSIPRSRTGKALDYLKNRSDIARAIRGAGQFITNPPSLTGPITEADAARSFNVASMFAGGGGMFRRPAGSIGTGGRPYKVSGAVPKTPVKKTPVPKPGSKKFIGPVQPAKPGSKGFIGPTQPPKAGQAGFIGPTRPASTSSGPKKRGFNKNVAVATGIVGTTVGITGGMIAGGAFQPPPPSKKVGGGPVSRQGSQAPSLKAKGGGPVSRQGSQAPYYKGYLVGTSGGKGVQAYTTSRNPDFGGKLPDKKATEASKMGKSSTQTGAVRKKNGAFTLGTGAQTAGVAKSAQQARPMASAKKEMTFQEATRRNQSDAYLKKKMRPKGNLLSLFKNRKK